MKLGGRGRLSPLVAGVVLLVMVVLAGPWVEQISMGTLLAVMIKLSIGTFSWSSIINLRTYPRSSSVVIVETVIVTVALKFRREGTQIDVIGLNDASTTLVERLGVYDKSDAVERLMGH